MCAGQMDCFAHAADRGALERALRREISRAEVEALGRRLSGRS